MATLWQHSNNYPSRYVSGTYLRRGHLDHGALADFPLGLELECGVVLFSVVLFSAAPGGATTMASLTMTASAASELCGVYVEFWSLVMVGSQGGNDGSAVGPNIALARVKCTRTAISTKIMPTRADVRSNTVQGECGV